MKWTDKGKQYNYMKSFFDKEHKYVIWGAGIYGISFFESYSDSFKIESFVDSAKEKQGKKIHGLDVISPESFIANRKDEIVLVATGFTYEVYNYLLMRGLQRSVDFFHIDEIVSLYMWFCKGKVCINDLILGITQRCTLNCNYCIAFVPQINKPIDYPMEKILHDVDVAMQWVDEVSVLGLVGGDAMMHKDFIYILESIAEKYYPNRIKHFDVYSNAIIPINDKAIELFKKYDVFYRFTDYSSSTDKQRIAETKELLSENNIRCDHAQLTEWFDCGYPQKSNGVKGEERLIRFFDACDRKECHMVKDEHLFSCGTCINADLIEYCNIEDSDYFDLGRYDKDRKIEFIEYYLGYSEKGYMNYCKMCNGGANINKKLVKVGGQG